jgi:8-oxo-dGTP pyrophosphatase MutT (NUDIX family)
MRIKFTEKELHSLQLEFVPRRNLSADYLVKRDEYWNYRAPLAQSLGKQLWNGEVYTVEKIDFRFPLQAKIYLSTCEYKDILFARDYGLEKVAQEFGVDSIQSYITVCCIPVTAGDRFVLGIRGGNTAVSEGALGLIGGTVNKDEMQVNSLNHLKEFMAREIEEETAIPVILERLKLFCLNYYFGKYEFIYRYSLPESIKNINFFHKSGEFSSLKELSLSEVLSFNRPMLDAVVQSKAYLSDLLTSS